MTAIRLHSIPCRRPRRAAFTLMEMITAVSLLVIVILAVGLIFQKASYAVSLSQAAMEVFSNARAVQYQIQSDFDNLDRNGFIVIRSRQQNGAAPNNRRVDQITFLCEGTFQHRTGTKDANNPFADTITANGALVWIGHLTYDLPVGTGAGPDQSTSIYSGGSTDTRFDVIAKPGDASTYPSFGANDGQYRLGHRVLLLAPNVGSANAPLIGTTFYQAAAFANPSLSAGNVTANAIDGANANITSSRVDAVAMTAGQLMGTIANTLGSGRSGGNARTEADNFCFRSKAPANPYETNNASPSPVVGAFRSSTIMLQGAPYFAIDWSDGSTTNGLLNWYGLDGLKKNDSAIEVSGGTSGDQYTAIFSVDNKAKWPKLIRFRYRVTDTNDRLAGGREITQVVRIKP